MRIPRLPMLLALTSALLLLATTRGAQAHNLGTTVTLITLGEASFEMRLECDLDALLLGAGPGADDAELAQAVADMAEVQRTAALEDLASLFLRRVRLFNGNERLEFEVDFPDREDGVTLAMVPPTYLGLTARLRGELPADLHGLRLRLSRAFPAAEVTVINAAGAIVLDQLVPRGEDSQVFSASGGVAEATTAESSGRSALFIGLAIGAFALLAWLFRGKFVN
ncbi:MAG: hypothetical protein GKS06_15120 [Acidobacteria bacterium]|nr:hypothetical protein [Acidobacteriota bacterium]